jgi:hypothetical protein
MMADMAGNFGYEFSDEFRDTETGNKSASDFADVSRGQGTETPDDCLSDYRGTSSDEAKAKGEK